MSLNTSALSDLSSVGLSRQLSQSASPDELCSESALPDPLTFAEFLPFLAFAFSGVVVGVLVDRQLCRTWKAKIIRRKEDELSNGEAQLIGGAVW